VAAREAFIARFQQGALPEDLAEVTLAAVGAALGIGHVLKGAGLVASTSDALRLLKQGAVRVDGERLDDPAAVFAVGARHVFQVGKRRYARVTIAAPG
jgi:tyrosyl-tRNA synthetase